MFCLLKQSGVIIIGTDLALHIIAKWGAEEGSCLSKTTHLVKVGAGLEHGLPNPQVVAFSFLPSIFMEHVLTTRQLSTISLASWTLGEEERKRWNNAKAMDLTNQRTFQPKEHKVTCLNLIPSETLQVLFQSELYTHSRCPHMKPQ